MSILGRSSTPEWDRRNLLSPVAIGGVEAVSSSDQIRCGPPPNLDFSL